MSHPSYKKHPSCSPLSYYALSVGLSVLVAGILFYGMRRWSKGVALMPIDAVLMYLLPIACGVGVYLLMRSSWHRRADGRYVRVPKAYYKNSAQLPKATSQEPQAYDIIAYNAYSEALWMSIAGIGLIGFSIFVFREGYILLPLFLLCFGLWVMVSGIKDFVNRKPQLKLSQTGIWTPQLGYRSREEIKALSIITKRRYKSPEWILEIYLHRPRATQALLPDDTLSLSSLTPCDAVIQYIQRYYLRDE